DDARVGVVLEDDEVNMFHLDISGGCLDGECGALGTQCECEQQGANPEQGRELHETESPSISNEAGAGRRYPKARFYQSERTRLASERAGSRYENWTTTRPGKQSAVRASGAGMGRGVGTGAGAIESGTRHGGTLQPLILEARMNAALFYRIAAVFLLLFAFGHTLGFRRSDPSWGVDPLL